MRKILKALIVSCVAACAAMVWASPGPGIPTNQNQFQTAAADETTTDLVYDDPGTYEWVAPPGVTTVTVECWGGGGGGSGGLDDSSFAHAGAGGGGGAYASKDVSVTPGTSYTITVGAGGTAGPGQFNTDSLAGDGGDSSFETDVVADGGTGARTTYGAAGSSSSTAGTKGLASASTGDTKYDGGDGAGDVGGTAGGGGGSSAGSSSAGADASGSTGGTAPINGGDGGDGDTASSDGAPGTLPGGAGGGGGANQGAGGAGAAGRVKLTWAGEVHTSLAYDDNLLAYWVADVNVTAVGTDIDDWTDVTGRYNWSRQGSGTDPQLNSADQNGRDTITIQNNGFFLLDQGALFNDDTGVLPVTVMILYYSPDIGTNYRIFNVGDASRASTYLRMGLFGGTALDPLQVRHTLAGGSTGDAVISSVYAATTWQVATARFVSKTSRYAEINSSSSAEDTTSVDIEADADELDNTALGAFYSNGSQNGQGDFNGGKIAAVAVFSEDVSDINRTAIRARWDTYYSISTE